MELKKVIPTIFYSDIKVGLNLFVDCLSFEVAYSEPKAQQPFYIIKRDSVTIYLTEDDEYAKKDRPQIRIETDDIEALYQEIKNKNMDLLHPNLLGIKLQPWGLKEFALLDRSRVCVVIQQA